MPPARSGSRLAGVDELVGGNVAAGASDVVVVVAAMARAVVGGDEVVADDRFDELEHAVSAASTITSRTRPVRVSTA